MHHVAERPHSLGPLCYVTAMEILAPVVPAFEVLPQADLSFSIRLSPLDGRARVIAGFGSRHEAAACVMQIERMFIDADPRLHPPKQG